MSEQPSIEELTRLNLFFGRVSEVHVKNMQHFPWIFFNDLQEVKLDYDIASSKGGVSSVSYDLRINKENDHLEKRFAALESAIRSIFWNDIRVNISINGQEVFKSV